MNFSISNMSNNIFICLKRELNYSKEYTKTKMIQFFLSGNIKVTLTMSPKKREYFHKRKGLGELFSVFFIHFHFLIVQRRFHALLCHISSPTLEEIKSFI